MARRTFFVLLLVLLAFFSPQNIFADTPKVYFSPRGGCQQAIIIEISKAAKTIDIAMYAFSSREIAQELVSAKDRGVKVRMVLDKAQETQTYSKSRFFLKKGFEVKYHTGSGLMHNKFAILDSKALITGSFNWTAGAEEKNDENLLIMTDPGLIKKYQDRFEYLWKRGRKGAV